MSGPPKNVRRLRGGLAAALPGAVAVALAAMVFRSIPNCWFFGDDLLGIYHVIDRPWVEVLFKPYGGHVCTARNLVYYGLYQLFGPRTDASFAVVLLTHLLNVGLLFVLLRRLTASALLAGFGAALWGAAPIQEGTLNWYSVYGQVMAVTAALWVLYRIVVVGERGRLSTLELASWVLVLFAASTSFGSGMLLAAAMPVLAWLLLPASSVRRLAVRALVAVAALVLVGYLVVSRLATTWFDVATNFGALLNLPNTAPTALDLGWRFMARGLRALWLGPLDAHAGPAPAYGPLILVLALVVGGAAFGGAGPTRRRQMLASLLLAAMFYGAIVIGRVILFPFLLGGDKLLAADRYQYAGALPLAMWCCFVLAQLGDWLRVSSRAATALFATWVVAFLALYVAAGRAIDLHPFPRRQAEMTFQTIDSFVRSQPPGATVYIDNQVFHGVGPFVLMVPQTFPGWAALFAVFQPDQMLDGRHVIFVDPRPDVVAFAQSGRRGVTFLVDPSDVPPGAPRLAPPAP